MLRIYSLALLLCWITCLLPLVTAQSNGGTGGGGTGGGDGNGGGGGGNGRFGNGDGRFRHHFGGGRFRGGDKGFRNGQNQDSQGSQTQDDNTGGDLQAQDSTTIAASSVPPPVSSVAVSSAAVATSAVAAATSDASDPIYISALVQPSFAGAISSAAPVSSAAVQVSSAVAAAPAVTSIASDALLMPSITTATVESVVPSGTVTMTEEMTVMVTPSPLATSAAAVPAAPASDSTPEAVQSSAPMSSSARAGMGIGISVGVMSVASMAGFYLYRRHQNKRFPGAAKGVWSRGGGGGLGSFTVFSVRKGGWRKKDDPEWEFGSAEKVEIVRGASARTVSRSTTPSMVTPPSTSSSNRMDSPPRLSEVIVSNGRIGLDVFDKVAAMKAPNGGRSARGNLKVANVALTSNPPDQGRLSVFPSPPQSVKGVLEHVDKDDLPKGEVKKTNSWPLPE